MRDTRLPFLLAAASAAALAACGGNVVVDPGVGGSATTSSSSSSSSGVTSSSSSGITSSSSSGSTSSSSGSTSSSGGAFCPAGAPLGGACAPTSICEGAGSTCLAHVDQALSKTPVFRMSQIDFKVPQVFTGGIVGGVVAGAVPPQDSACNIAGGGTFSWLLQFDRSAGTLTTGGAKPTQLPEGPYSFVSEVLPSGLVVQPVTVAAPLGSGCAFESSAGDLVLPLYLDPAATQVIHLPIRGLRFHGGQISGNQGCIGRYNAEGLDPQNVCLPDGFTKYFTTGAAFDAFMNLEDTDKIAVSSLNQSLCVLLSGDPTKYGEPSPMGMTVCRRVNGQILFKGDWCSSSNGPATTGCADAVAVAGSFAAQAVKVQ